MQRNTERNNFELFAIVGLMLIVGAAGWWLRLGPQLYVDASPLADIPTQIGRWQSSDIPLDSVVERKLRADFNLQRVYVTRLGEPIWLYVGYYSTQRGGRPEHTPRGCYASAGWAIESNQTIEVDPNGALRANEYLVEQHGERRLVHFWCRSHRRSGILGGFDQNTDRMLGLLLDRRADGALVRISTPVTEDDTISSRGRLRLFASLLDPLLGEHWPTEFACDEASPDACAPKTGFKGDEG